MDIFNISPAAIVSQILAFLLLIWAMRKYLFGPIGAVLEARQNEVQSTLERISADRQAMEQTRAEYEQRITSVDCCDIRQTKWKFGREQLNHNCDNREQKSKGSAQETVLL